MSRIFKPFNKHNVFEENPFSPCEQTMFHFNDVFEMIVRDHVSFTLLNFKIAHIELLLITDFLQYCQKKKKKHTVIICERQVKLFLHTHYYTHAHIIDYHLQALLTTFFSKNSIGEKIPFEI